MRRALGFGCLTIFLALFVGGGIYVYVNFFKPARDVFTAAKGVGEIQKIDARVANRAAFTPPADGLLSGESVERYLAVQEGMREALEGRLSELQVKYAELADRSDLTFTELAGAWSDVMGLLVLAKEAQVEALNAAGFSRAEYDWTRGRALEAVGIRGLGYDLAAVLQGGEGGSGAPGGAHRASVPAENVELVAPHLERVKEHAVFAFFGL